MRLVFERGRVFCPRKVLRMLAILCHLLVLNRMYLFLDHLVRVLFLFACLHLVLCCVSV